MSNHADVRLRWRKDDGSRLVWSRRGELRMCGGASGPFRVVATSVSRENAFRWAKDGGWRLVGRGEGRWILRVPEDHTRKYKSPPDDRPRDLPQSVRDEIDRRIRWHMDRVQAEMNQRREQARPI